MKIALSNTEMFWGLMNPKTMQITLMLNEYSPVAEIDEKQLEKWALKQITESVKKKKISISVQLEELLKSDKTEAAIQVEEKPKKPAAVKKKVATKALKA